MAKYIDRGSGKRGGYGARITIIVLAIVILLGARSLASFSIEYQWWKELGQIDTWLAMLAYGFAPLLAATLIAFGVLWVAHARALKFAGTRLSEHPVYAWISGAALPLLRRAVRGRRGRAEVCRHETLRASRLRLDLRRRPAVFRVSHRGRLYRDLDRGPLYRRARHSGRGQCVARFRFRSAAQVLSVRSAVLLRPARLFTGAGHCQRAGLLDRGARLATPAETAGNSRFAANRPVALPVGRRARKPLPTRRPGGFPAGAIAAFLPGALSNGLRRSRVHGGHRLRGPAFRAAAAVAGDRGVHGGGRTGVAAALDSGCQHGGLAGGAVRRAAAGGCAVCAAQ